MHAPSCGGDRRSWGPLGYGDRAWERICLLKTRARGIMSLSVLLVMSRLAANVAAIVDHIVDHNVPGVDVKTREEIDGRVKSRDDYDGSASASLF
ncbi:hypothetical protein LA080_011085 [Diaporthe eres]|nr:hypothetical protein LA080_011085 [Diaporthe eres]